MPTKLEQKLLDHGYNAFDLEEKNLLINELARKAALPYNEITEEYILEYHKCMKTEVISRTGDYFAIQGYKATNSHTYPTGFIDQFRMLAQKVELISKPLEDHVYWKTEDQGFIYHTRQEWLQVYEEMYTYLKMIVFRSDSLKQKVKEALTHEDIVAITWETPLEVPPEPTNEEPAATPSEPDSGTGTPTE